jgi:hypothetical protein
MTDVEHDAQRYRLLRDCCQFQQRLIERAPDDFRPPYWVLTMIFINESKYSTIDEFSDSAIEARKVTT